MNHFFAVALPEELRRQIAEYCHAWRELLGPGFPAHWHDSDDYHITLKFLGDIEAARQDELVAAAEPIGGQSQAFHLSVNGPSAFPNARFAHVLIGHVYPSEELRTLHRHIDLVMQPCGFAPDTRGFVPHITVARCSHRPKSLRFPYTSDERPFYEFIVDHFVLMQTLPREAHRNGGKARYNIVHTFPFGNPQS